MKIDSHQHFWYYRKEDFGWINEEMKVLKRDFLPDDLKLLLDEKQIDGSVAVQAAQSDSETMFLLGLAKEYDFIKGVVGWVDLKADKLKSKVASYAQEEKLKGFRHILQSEPKGFMLEKSFVNGVSMLSEYGYSYDILIYEHQIDEAIELVSRLPEMKIVIDHMAKPSIKDKKIDRWAKGIKNLSKFPHVHMKVSGLITEADWMKWKAEDITPYMEMALDSFGADRLMYGSDWPVCLLAGKYTQVFEISESFKKGLSDLEMEKIMGLNAERFYNLNDI